jgi:hypothetical protein
VELWEMLDPFLNSNIINNNNSSSSNNEEGCRVEVPLLVHFLRTKDDIIKTNMMLDISNYQYRHNNDQHVAATML